MITLSPTRLHWLKDDGDDQSDVCAHSPVLFQIEDEILVAPSDGNVTVSAAAIYLLRTLERDHTKENPVGEQLLPCCGHALFDTGDEDVLICGCPNGSNIWVNHIRDGAIRLTATSGKSFTVTENDWREAVKVFSDLVRQFYDQSPPKTPAEPDKDGFLKMMAEWDRRRSQA